MYINSSGLSILLATFAVNDQYPPWYSNIFGAKSVFYGKDRFADILQPGIVSQEQSFWFSTNTSSNEMDHKICCSIQLFGVTVLKDDTCPFCLRQRFLGPAIGHGSITVVGAIHLKCIYRAVYENWRRESYLTEPNYWSLFMFCPVKNCEDCRHIINSNLSYFVNLFAFSGKILYGCGKLQIKRKQRSEGHIAVCSVSPYASSNVDRRKINKFLLLNWLVYYLRMNLFVYYYDSRNNILEIEEFIKNMNISSRLYYHNFTVRSLISPENYEYDNSERTMKLNATEKRSMRRRHYLQGFDKTLTLTLCRFEAWSNFDITNILVVDFDEFLFFPSCDANFFEQGLCMGRFVAWYTRLGFDQVTVPQRIVASNFSSLKLCALSQINRNLSLFSCFLSLNYYAGGHSVKSFHINYVCPLTGYHHAVPQSNLPKFYDCTGNNHDIRLGSENNQVDGVLLHFVFADNLQLQRQWKSNKDFKENEIYLVLKDAPVIMRPS